MIVPEVKVVSTDVAREFSNVPLRVQLPNELIDNILSHLPVKELVRLSSVCRAWHVSVCAIFRARVSAAFDFPSQFRYVFESSQPADKQVTGNILKLRSRTRMVDDSKDIVAEMYTTFDFVPSEMEGSKTYKFTMEPDGFIQLCVLGNIIQPRKSGVGLEGVAQHIEDFCRIKKDNIDNISVGVMTLKINAVCLLRVRLIESTAVTSLGQDGPMKYCIEYDSLLLKSAHLLHALEVYIASTLTSTALVLRAWA